MNNGLLKYTLFSIMGFSLLLCFIAYGFSIMALEPNATYLQQQLTQTSYGYVYTKYTFNWTDYVSNLQKNWFQTIADHLRWYKIRDAFNNITYTNEGDNTWEQILYALKFVGNILKNILNVIIFIVNILFLAPLQFIFAILIYMFTIVGINVTNGAWWLGNTLNWINTNLWIPYVN